MTTGTTGARSTVARWGLQPVTRKAHYAARGAWYLLTLTVSLALLLLLANSAVEVLPFVRECYFPPCY